MFVESTWIQHVFHHRRSLPDDPMIPAAVLTQQGLPAGHPQQECAVNAHHFLPAVVSGVEFFFCLLQSNGKSKREPLLCSD